MLFPMRTSRLSFRFDALRHYAHDGGAGTVVAVFFAVAQPGGLNRGLSKSNKLVADGPRRMHPPVPNSIDRGLPGADGGTNGLLRHPGGDEVLNGC